MALTDFMVPFFASHSRNEGWIEDIRNRIPALPFFTSLRVCGRQKGKAGQINEQLSKRERREITFEVLFYSIAVLPDRGNLLSSGSGSCGLMGFCVRPEGDLSGLSIDRTLRVYFLNLWKQM
ncbi:hypothetical protein CDAR_524431 [Caerostris darwini]|uniref:Uncharacterized protein n=1 Tax=Caerostris darwini TaxID=1538125 RepID=A0AAV4VW83_9ARAC|nr:hypothetical protein CDAR_524431 [Caerostris darwini]